MGEKIMVVDDEVSILTLLEYHLLQSGFEVVLCTDGEQAVKLAKAETPGLILLDLMLPRMDGLEVCRQLRDAQLTMPVIMITAKDEEFDKILGLELGADDYITKPFSPREVVARVKAVLRRSNNTGEDHSADSHKTLELADLKVFPEKYEAYFKNDVMELTPKEFELLLYLMRNKGKVMSREQLLNAVWNYEFMGDTRIVDVHVSHLREKIEENTRRPKYIKTIRGLGYKLEQPHAGGGTE
ncbi:MAG TPA: response regulator transcription factor [Bacillales bacterium]|nr:response regulator transcription factor [Bacillales bacterium]